MRDGADNAFLAEVGTDRGVASRVFLLQAARCSVDNDDLTAYQDTFVAVISRGRMAYLMAGKLDFGCPHRIARSPE